MKLTSICHNKGNVYNFFNLDKLHILRGSRVEFPNYNVFVPLKSVLIFANSAYPDEMLQFVASHLGLHCSPVYLFEGLQ